MIRVKFEDFKAMYGSQSYNALYHKLLPITRGQGDGSFVIRNEELTGEAFVRQFAEWSAGVEHLPLAAPAAPAPTPASPGDDLARLQQQKREQAAAQEKVIEDAANTRAAWYVSDQGLLDDDRNRDLLLGWFEINKAEYTAHNVDLAISQLTDQLIWAVWSPRLQPVEEVRRLENGEPELPLNASADEIRRASKAQVDDLSRRKGEFTAHRRGSFGAKFITPTF